MGTLNIGAAASFGLLGQILYLNSSALGGQGTINYSYGYVDASQLYNQVPLGAMATETVQTASNVQAMQNLFNDPSSVNPGFNLENGIYGRNGSGTIDTNFPVTSTMTITTVPVPAGSYNVNLSTATQTSNNPTEVAASSLQFIFIPGSTQSQSLTYSEGATISESVTNGITNTTTNAEGQTVALSETCATSVTGGVPGDSTSASASESAAISYAWSQTSSQSTNYSTTNTSQTNTTVSSTTTVNLNTATPNADGSYTYGAYT
ncbi:hypothetical protein ICN30_00010 [Polynucleobacter sp. 31A-FELB]|uniref:hypothetical protein n=1 Tax=Polynucleobacter sp. 31A-FELB TaxID=2689096 RepID=UPI001C0E0586|nr:hypothetical protein [Polynucleobacter sp. 31A-FELB]MBU3586223.1 hypothetical protein [Polynucleobacter sp. 31A-FELB]